MNRLFFSFVLCLSFTGATIAQADHYNGNTQDDCYRPRRGQRYFRLGLYPGVGLPRSSSCRDRDSSYSLPSYQGYKPVTNSKLPGFSGIGGGGFGKPTRIK